MTALLSVAFGALAVIGGITVVSAGVVITALMHVRRSGR